MRGAVFLDRDGILNAAVVIAGRPHPPRTPDEVRFVPGVRERIIALRHAGLLAVCVTNQPDVARGTALRTSIERINARIQSQYPLDELLVCFHDDADNCRCRKPSPGLLLDAATRRGIDLPRSYMIGDRWKDVACGAAAGCTTVFVDYAYAEQFQGPSPSHVCRSVASGLDYILKRANSTA